MVEGRDQRTLLAIKKADLIEKDIWIHLLEYIHYTTDPFERDLLFT